MESHRILEEPCRISTGTARVVARAVALAMAIVATVSNGAGPAVDASPATDGLVARGGLAWRDYFPNVELTTHNGDRVRFYDDLIQGKVVVINFMYATCTDS